MNRHILLPAAIVLLGLAACEREAPTPEAPPMEPPAQAPVEPPADTSAPTRTSYVGLWAADPAWCANETGPERPIRITETTFTGYENQCEIADARPADGGWTATFTCQAEGTTNIESVGMQPDGDRLELTWIGSGQTVTFTRCAE